MTHSLALYSNNKEHLIDLFIQKVSRKKYSQKKVLISNFEVEMFEKCPKALFYFQKIIM